MSDDENQGAEAETAEASKKEEIPPTPEGSKNESPRGEAESSKADAKPSEPSSPESSSPAVSPASPAAPPPPPASPEKAEGDGSASETPPASPGSRPPKRKKGEKVDLNNARYGIIGAGKMAEAIARGLNNFSESIFNFVSLKFIFGLFFLVAKATGRVYLASKSARNHDVFKQMNVTCSKRSYDIFGKMDCDVIFLAFHGFVVRALFKTGGTRPLALTTNYIPNQKHPVYLLSLVGGIPMYDIRSCLLNPDCPEKYKVSFYRIMLNTSIMYGIGLSIIDIEPDSKKCVPVIRDTLNSFSKLEYMPESVIDTACAVGGNGLAFVFYFLSSLSDSAFKLGIPKQMAVKLAARTLQSAAGCILESGKNPSELRDGCTSPSGPAIYGCQALEKKEVAHGISATLEGALKRIKELANKQITD